jgi:hypothetical protein
VQNYHLFQYAPTFFAFFFKKDEMRIQSAE